MKNNSLTLLLTSVISAFLLSCGSGSPPSAPSRVGASHAPTSVAVAGDAHALAAAQTTVGDILARAPEQLGLQVQLQGKLTQSLGESVYVFDDGTGTIPASFAAAATVPMLNQMVNITATIGPASSGSAASLVVISWEIPKSFSCEDIEEVRARFSDPGFAVGNVVGLFLSYRGIPAGDKTAEIDWGNGFVENFDVEVPGTPRDDGRFNLEGVVGYEYPNIKGTQQKTVRATIRIKGRTGQCARVRKVTVRKGTGPGFAAGGALRVSVDDPVPSGAKFTVTASVKNPTRTPFDAKLLFHSADNTFIESTDSGCRKVKSGVVECRLQDVPGKGRKSKEIRYIAPEVSKSLQISGSVTLLSEDLAPVANYRTTIEAPACGSGGPIAPREVSSKGVNI